jgi:hypothetical protein
MPFDMPARSRAVHTVLQAVAGLSLALLGSIGTAAAVPIETQGIRARVPPWPCRLVVKPTLLGVVEDGWETSATLRRQCEDLAAARAVVVLQWGSTDSQSRALSRMDVQDGVVVAHITIPPVSEAFELVAHELQHVLEKVRGLDFEGEAGRPGSGVWRAFGGYETQAAIDAGRQAAREAREARHPRR